VKELSLFTGGGGGVYASKLLGHEIVGYVEFNEYCQKIIKQRIIDGIFDEAPIFGDIREFDATPYCGSVDIITGGFPCQPFSVAGRKKGKDDSRNMWPETIRVIKQTQPKEAFLENVPGLLSSGYFSTILNDLSQAGYDAKWITLSASDCGAPHKRERLWILANTRCERWKTWTDENLQFEGKKSIGKNFVKLREPVSNTFSTRLEGYWNESSGASKKHSSLSNSRWWSTEPELGRVAHGVANRKHRLTALGNGQVSIVARNAYLILKEQSK
jgi:DNA (cytosine-5)-methyltransferase 1